MKCDRCNGTGRRMEESDNGIGWIPIKCEYCNGTGEVEQTNEEWFCQLPTGEKADFLADIYPKSVGEALIKISNGDKEKWEEWLKQPHKG